MRTRTIAHFTAGVYAIAYICPHCTRRWWGGWLVQPPCPGCGAALGMCGVWDMTTAQVP